MSQWNARASTYGRDYGAASIRAHVADLVVSRASEARPQIVVDAGGGHGHLTELLRAALPETRVILVDNSAEMLRHAADRLGADPMVDLLHTGMDRLRMLADGSVDFFTSTFAIHHLQDDAKFLTFKEARRVLRPKGVLFIVDEIICDPTLRDDPGALFAMMGEIFYPELSRLELQRKFEGFVEYPTDLTGISQMLRNAGFEATLKPLNPIVAAVEGVPALAPTPHVMSSAVAADAAA